MSKYLAAANVRCPPVLLLVFNRPQLADRVFERIRSARPPKLYISADGPRPDVIGEAERCSETRRRILEQIDWQCEVEVLVQDKNLGCGLGPLSGINWFFDNEPEGIVLEDDCLPADSFFSFSHQMLEYYRSDERVMAISGTNILGNWEDKSAFAYLFSYYGGNWGWASWRRAWMKNDHLLTSLTPSFIRRRLEDVLGDKSQADGVIKLVTGITGRESDVWDIQWFCSRLLHRGLSIVPTRNMVTNIGFGPLATHTKSKTQLGDLRYYETSVPTPINPNVEADREFDRQNARMYGWVNIQNQSENLWSRISAAIQSALK